MDNVFTIDQGRRVFSIQEAGAMLPLVLRMTAEAQRKVGALMNRREAIKYGSADAAKAIEQEIQAVVDLWNQKMRRLGGHPKGVWMADFDNGKGYFCWKYPESEIRYKHGYHDGYAGRKEI